MESIGHGKTSCGAKVRLLLAHSGTNENAKIGLLCLSKPALGRTLSHVKSMSKNELRLAFQRNGGQVVLA